jgi:hypothetical protein
MKQISPAILIFTNLLLTTTVGAQPQQLHEIFDGAQEKIDLDYLIDTAITPETLTPHDIQPGTPFKKPLSLILAERENGTSKDFYTPQDLWEQFIKEYGGPPSEEDKKQIRTALTELEDTKFGSEMCKSIAYGCTIESFERAGIRLRVRKIPFGENQTANGVVPAPINFAGSTFIGLSKEIVGESASTSQLALTLLHEMSHVEDLKDNKVGTLENAGYASEEKAMMTQIAGYDELSRKDKELRDPFYIFLVEFWAWKNENGRYPKRKTLYLPFGPKGKYIDVSTKDLIENYMAGISYWDSMQRLVYNLWHRAYGDPPVNDKLVKAIRKVALERSKAYMDWRANPPAPPPAVASPAPKPPKPPKPPHDDDGGSNDGGGGDTGGGSFNPGPYNPHFGEGI